MTEPGVSLEEAAAVVDAFKEAALQDSDNRMSLGVAMKMAAVLDSHTTLLNEVDRLHSWPGLMSLLDEHWPEDIFPTLEDDEKRDAGPRIISLLRWVDRLQALLFQIREARVDYDAALFRREHGGVAADRFMRDVFASLDREERP